MKKALVILLALTMVMSMFAMVPASAADEELAVGQVAADYKPEGTAINNAAEFAAMDPAGTYYLAADITIDETYALDFTGTFDGNGKSITTSVPVFAEFDGVLKNLTTKGAVNIEGVKEGTYEINRGVVANIVGHYADTEITNVCNMAPITSATLGIGGVVGYVSNDEQYKVTFTKVVNYGNITASNTSTSLDCAGIAAQFDGDDGVLDYYVKFIDCANYGTINACGRPGGIMGYANASTAFINCYNAGEIQSTANYCGGIAGRLDGDHGGSDSKQDQAVLDAEKNIFLLENCVNDGKVIVWQSQGAGMVGYCGGFRELIYRNCVNNGDVVGSDANDVALTLAGIHGSNKSTGLRIVFENCVNNGNIGFNTTSKKISAGGISGGLYGIDINFVGCVNNGTIKGTSGNVGGITANAPSGAAQKYEYKKGSSTKKANRDNLTMFATVTKCVNNGDIYGGTGWTAGLVGYMYASAAYGPTFTYCVNTGNVKSNLIAAGLVGYYNNYYAKSKFEYNIIGGTIKGGDATVLTPGVEAKGAVRVPYAFVDSNGNNKYFFAPVAGKINIANDVVTFTPDAALTVVTVANGDNAAKGDICKFLADDGNYYVTYAPTAGAVTIDVKNATLTDASGITTIGVKVDAAFDGTSVVLNTYDHPISGQAMFWNNNSSVAIDMSKNVVVEGAAEMDYIQGLSNKWCYVGNTSATQAKRTSPDDIKSGKVAYDLNEAIGETVFYQNIDSNLFTVDVYPTTDSAHAKVVYLNGQYQNQLFDMSNDSGSPATGDAIVYVVVALAVSTISLAAVAVCKKIKEN